MPRDAEPATDLSPKIETAGIKLGDAKFAIIGGDQHANVTTHPCRSSNRESKFYIVRFSVDMVKHILIIHSKMKIKTVIFGPQWVLTATVLRRGAKSTRIIGTAIGAL